MSAQAPALITDSVRCCCCNIAKQRQQQHTYRRMLHVAHRQHPHLGSVAPVMWAVRWHVINSCNHQKCTTNITEFCCIFLSSLSAVLWPQRQVQKHSIFAPLTATSSFNLRCQVESTTTTIKATSIILTTTTHRATTTIHNCKLARVLARILIAYKPLLSLCIIRVQDSRKGVSNERLRGSPEGIWGSLRGRKAFRRTSGVQKRAQVLWKT